MNSTKRSKRCLSLAPGLPHFGVFSVLASIGSRGACFAARKYFVPSSPYSEELLIRIVITGVAGFIGSTTAASLLQDGHEVVGIDALTDYYDPKLKKTNLAALTHSSFTFVPGDLNELNLEALLSGAEAVIHLAGQPGVRASWGNEFDTYIRDNISATQRLLEAARTSATLLRFVYGSSSSVYGQADSYPTDESTLTKPFSPYGVTKLAGEHLVSLYRENFGLPSVSFRFFTVYGPRQRPDMAFSKFLRATSAQQPITVYGDGTQIRDFTFVDDIVAALTLAVNEMGDLPRVMNLAGGSSVSVLEVLEIIHQVTDVAPRIEFRPAVDGDVTRTGGSSELARNLLGWSPTKDVATGIALQHEWMRSRG